MKTGSGRRKTVLGQRPPFSLGRRLFHDTGGQVLLFGAVLAVAILAFMLSIPNGTQVTTQKVRAQTAADIGAFSGSVWLARALNLNANLNVGIKSVYTWATVLTMGSALAQALYTDTIDDGVQQMGMDLVAALFNTSNPPPVVTYVEYPAALQSLSSTGHWLADLQDDIAESFHDVAATLGTEEACRNAGAYPPSQTAGGWVLVRSNDTTDTAPLLGGAAKGESLMYDDLRLIGDDLESIPSGHEDIGPAVGEIVIDPDSFDIYAYYGFEREWYEVKYFMHYTMFWIMHTFRNKTTLEVDSQYAFIEKPGEDPWKNFLLATTWPDERLPQDSWAPWSPYKMGQGRDSFSYQLLRVWPGGNDKYKIDTCWWVPNSLPKWYDTAWYSPGGDSVVFPDSNWIHDSTQFITEYFVGADSTVTHEFDKVSPRRPNPDREYHSASYVWRHGATTSPFGLGPPLGGALFPRGKVAAPSPLFTVARAVPYLAIGSPTDYDYYFTPGWDVRLTPFDSVGVLEIASDTALGGYAIHSRGSFDNLEELRKHVLLP
jgi:hypothetical protein